jgi:hypothetical protein
MPSDTNVVHPGKRSAADEDEIIAGEQRISLKCSVGLLDADLNEGDLTPLAHVVELRPHPTPCPVEEMRSHPMF